jgi:hypothetical protein
MGISIAWICSGQRDFGLQRLHRWGCPRLAADYRGTPKEVKEYCRKLIEVCGEAGGFILTGGAGIHKGDPNSLHAMTEAVMEYGVY